MSLRSSLGRVTAPVIGRLRWIAGARTGSSAVAQTLLGRILVVGVSLLNGILSARYLGSSGRGAQAAMGLWPQFLCFILTFGIPFGVTFHARKHSESRDELISAAFVYSAILGVVAAIVGALFVPFWLRQYDHETIAFAQILMIFAPQIMLTLVMNSAFDVRLDFAPSNILRFGPPLLTLMALLSLIGFHRFTPFASALAYAATPAILSLVLLPRMFSAFRFTLSDFKRSTKRLFGYGVRVYGADIFGTFGQQVDQILVVGLLSASDLGVYTVALSASRVLNIFQSSVRIVLFPKVTGLETPEIVTLISRVARLSTAMTVLGAVILIATLPFLLPHLYGRDFSRSIAVAQLLTVESIIASTTAVLTQAFMATDKPGVATVLQGVGLATAVPLMLALIPSLGLLGAAIALLCSTTVRLIIALLCFPLLLKVPMPSLIVRRADIRYLRDAVRNRGVGRI